MLAIPADAPHPGNAHLFIDYLLRLEVAVKDASAIKYANPVTASIALFSPELANDPGVYPPAAARAKFIPIHARSEAFMKLLNRMWARFKTGR